MDTHAHSAHASRSDPLSIADAIKPRLRELIAGWSARNPHRIIMRISAKDIEQLAHETPITKLAVFSQLDGYVGAALTSGYVRIPWPYELRVLVLSDAIEVLLRSDELEAHPLRHMADEVAFIAHEQSRAINIDEVFSFTVPLSILARVEKLSMAQRAQFRSTFSRRLVAYGLSAHAGSIAGGLQIRRNR